MSLIRRNLLLTAADCNFRVLYVDFFSSGLVVLDISKQSGWPELLPLEEIDDDIACGNLSIVEDEPRILTPDSEIPQHMREYRDRAWSIIRPFVENNNIAYDKNNRCKFIAEARLKHNISRPTIVHYLQCYWRGGMTPNALLPKWDRCGAAGQTRSVGTLRRGRPSGEGRLPGLNITPEIRQCFARSISLYYAKSRDMDLTDAYHCCLRKYFVEETRDEQGRLKFVPKPGFVESGFPTFGQFRYWVNRDLCRRQIERRRWKPRVFDMKHRALLDTAAANAWGPTARYEIDATLCDISLCSRRSRSEIIGRPTVYVVIDVFSRMIVGIYVGLEEPSWRAAMTAIANAVEPKKEFCARFGVTIQHDEWPCAHLCSILLGDRGEIESQKIIPLLQTFSITVENAAAYRGDWKGTVESRFHILHRGFKPYVPGSIDKSRSSAGDRDPRLTSLLNIEEFTQIIIHLVLEHNNYNVIENYDRSAGMTEDSVPSIPREIWDWGLPMLAGQAKTPSPEVVRLALLPRGSGSVTPMGIKFAGLYYACGDPLVQNLASRARSGRFSIEIVYDSRDSDYIYVNVSAFLTPHLRQLRMKADQSTTWIFCELLNRSRSYRGLCREEVQCMQSRERAIHAEWEREATVGKINTIAQIQNVVASADASSSASIETGVGRSAASKLRTLRSNRHLERDERRVEEAKVFASVLRRDSFQTFTSDVENFQDAEDLDLPPLTAQEWEASND